jgi:hypothetical protein
MNGLLNPLLTLAVLALVARQGPARRHDACKASKVTDVRRSWNRKGSQNKQGSKSTNNDAS